MAGRKPYYTSDDLVDAVKRDQSFPLTQVTYSEDDILEFANEELFLEQVPSVMEHHEEYFVFSIDVPLEENESRYDIPSRAIGMKLRDLFYVDDQDNLYPMSNIGAGNQDFYQMNNSNYTNPQYYFIEGNEIVLVPKMGGDVAGSLRMKFYLRPNSLVLNERAGICENFVKQITVVNASVTSGDTITLGDYTLTAGTDFAIGVSGTATATNISTAINNLDDQDITATSADDVVSVLFQDRNLDIAVSDSAAFTISDDLGIQVEEMPENFADGMYVDFLQTEGGHKTYDYNIRVPRNGVSSDTVFFNEDDVPEKFVVGDYICEAGECIIPQIPSDLHMLLVQRTSARILEAQGDTEGASRKTAKVQALEGKQATIIDNRTEGSPKKVFNRYSLLRAGKRGRNRRF
jgi:hypothetical protein